MRNHSLIRTTILVLLFSAGLSQTAWAQDPIHKAGRGVTNFLTGWIEIPKQMHEGSKASNGVVGISRGAARGFGLMFLRMGVGFFEAVTFPFEYPAKFASPYVDMELPDYAWE